MRRFNSIASYVAIPIVFLFLSTAGVGCTATSDLAKVDQARQIYVASLRVIVPLLEQGATTDQKILDGVYASKNEIRDILKDAETAAIEGRKLDVHFFLDKVLVALDRFILYKYQVKAAARKKGLAVPDEVGVVNPGKKPGTTTLGDLGSYSIGIWKAVAARSGKPHSWVC